MTLFPLIRRRIVAGLAAMLGTVLVAASPLPAQAAEDYSPAERALFMTNHLAGLKPPAALKYRYVRSGSMGDAFDDAATVKLGATEAGKCCAVTVDFLSGARKLTLGEIEASESNPAILFFLERDIREMEKLTTGKANYFRKRIRMAVYQGAQLKDASLPYKGKAVPVQTITVRPYVDDPLRARFEKYAGKSYVFVLSSAVPGGLYGIRSRIDGATPDAPLAVEELLADGAQPLPPTP